MSVALDLGTSCFRSLRPAGGRLLARRFPAVYVAVDDLPAQRRLLESSAIPYVTSDGGLVVMGDPALEIARMLKRPCVPLLPQGQIPEHDPLGRQVIAAALESLLPQGNGDECAMILPIATQRSPEQQMFFERLLRLRGYRPTTVTSGEATILATLGDQAFTGIGFSLGASGARVTIGHRGRILAEATSPRGGDWLDEQFAFQTERFLWDADGNQYLDLNAIAQWKNQTALSVLNPQTREEGLITDLYRELLRPILAEGATLCQKTPWLATYPTPLQLVCTGGPTKIQGFSILMRHLLQALRWPVEIGEIRCPAGDEFLNARGALIRATLDNSVAAAA